MNDELDNPDLRKLPLWGFGWAYHDDVLLSKFDSPSSLIDSYIQSSQFQTSFLKVGLAAGLHGPFQSSSLTVSDFRQVSNDEFMKKIDAVRQPPGFTVAASDEQWIRLLAIVKQMTLKPWLFVLTRTEEDKELFHEWGFVLGIVFREFLAGSPEDCKIERLVISLD